MVRSRVTATLLIAFFVAPVAVFELACSRSPEQQFLTQFFRAARVRDNTTLGMMSAVTFDPREQGSVSRFEIAAVTPEQSIPMDLKALVEAERRVRADEAEFAKQKRAYQDANLAAIEQVLKMERDPTAKMPPALSEVKAEWDTWREETSTYAKATSNARSALANATGPAEASLTQPGQPSLDPEQFEGEMISKAVTVNAQVQAPGGETSEKMLVVTMQRAVGKRGDQVREGRWIITRIEGA